ncbi:hypothetical protein V2J09_009120 [Rumex salicifolius]
MMVLGLLLSSSWYSICKVLAGVAGNIFAFGLFVSPIPTFKRIVRHGSTEQFSGLPYIYALLNCLLSAWYGTPIVSSNNIMVLTVNSVGAVFQSIYIIFFIAYADRVKKMKMLGLLSAVVFIFGLIVAISLILFHSETRRIFIGFLSCASLISMFASPLFIINLVIRTKSVEYMPFYLSLSTFLMSTSFCLYGIFNDDPFVYVPNGIGVILGSLQLGLYTHYVNKPNEDCTESLLIQVAGTCAGVKFITWNTTFGRKEMDLTTSLLDTYFQDFILNWSRRSQSIINLDIFQHYWHGLTIVMTFRFANSANDPIV